MSIVSCHFLSLRGGYGDLVIARRVRRSRHCEKGMAISSLREGYGDLVIARRVLPTKQSSINLLIFRTGLLRREYPSRNDEIAVPSSQ
jgi:hypothetical protein